jgi:hypothetical protein
MKGKINESVVDKKKIEEEDDKKRRQVEEMTKKKMVRPVVVVFVTCKTCSPNIQETMFTRTSS